MATACAACIVASCAHLPKGGVREERAAALAAVYAAQELVLLVSDWQDHLTLAEVAALRRSLELTSEAFSVLSQHDWNRAVPLASCVVQLLRPLVEAGASGSWPGYAAASSWYTSLKRATEGARCQV